MYDLLAPLYADCDILLVEGKWNTLAKVENALPELERSLGLTITCKRTGERERSTEARVGEDGCQTVIKGEGDNEGAFALTAQCGPWR